MNLQPYPKPSIAERIKIAAHYLLPQLLLTQCVGWLAQQRWGKVTHFIIDRFARHYCVNWQEAQKSKPGDYATFNEFFTRTLKDGARPIIADENTLCLPADGRVSESGTIDDNRLLQAKGHLFTLEDLLAGDTELAAQFRNGTFLTTYLSPRDYHRVHMPCAGTLRRMIYVSGELFSVNPFLAQHIPNLFARNERVICVFDTEYGPMVQILVGATITASMSTVWHGVVNPPRQDGVREWHYPADGETAVHLAKGEEMGAFQLGSTVVNLFAPGRVTLHERLQAGAVTTLGECLGWVAK